MNFGIAVFPSKEVQDFANSYRKRYDPHYNLIQPHMTLIEKQEWNERQLAEVIEHLGRITQEVEPFTIHFNRFSTFYPVNNVIYLALSDPQPFVEFYKRICTGVLDNCEEARRFRFNPHLTVGQEMGNDELHDVLSSVRTIPVDFTFKVDRIHLLYQTENGAWTAHQTFILGKKC
jgi:2'-5' RNA ligase